MDRDLPFEQAITFTIPSKSQFPILSQSDLDTDEVKLARGAAPLFFEKILTELNRQRVVPSGVSTSHFSFILIIFFLVYIVTTFHITLRDSFQAWYIVR
jgi:hypothetical protein